MILNTNNFFVGGKLLGTILLDSTIHLAVVEPLKPEFQMRIGIGRLRRPKIRNFVCKDFKTMHNWLEQLVRAGAYFDKVASNGFAIPSELLMIIPDEIEVKKKKTKDKKKVFLCFYNFFFQFCLGCTMERTRKE